MDHEDDNEGTVEPTAEWAQRPTDLPDQREPGLLYDLMRRALQTSISTIATTEQGVRTVVGAVAEKDLLNHAVASVDATRREAVSILGREVHSFLQNLNVGEELAKILTSVSFEIRTEVRFVPNEDGTLRATVKTGGGPKVVVSGIDDDPAAETPQVGSPRATRRQAMRSLVERVAEATAATARAAAEVAADAAADMVNEAWQDRDGTSEPAGEPETAAADEPADKG